MLKYHLVIAAGVSLLAGCSGNVKQLAEAVGEVQQQAQKASQAAADGGDARALKALGLAWHNYHDAYNVGPPNWNEFIAFTGQSGGDVQALTRLHDGGYVVAWSYRFRDVIIGASNFVMAFHPRAQQAGGLVAMLDGSVRHMPAGELQAALQNQASVKQFVRTTGGSTAAPSGTAGGGPRAPGSNTPGSGGTSRPSPFPPPGIDARPGAARAAGAAGGALPGGGPVTDDTPLEPGDKLFGLWGSRWYDVEVVEVLGNGEVKIHYVDYSDSWDEPLPRSKLRLKEPVAATTAGTGPAAVNPQRTWTDASGRFQIQAQFVELKDGVVRLRKPTGEFVQIPLERLSVTDQQEARRRAGDP